MNQTETIKRIVITGASGVGKTSLAQLLADKLHLPLVPEVAREVCREMGFDNPTQITNQEEFKQKVLERQIAAESRQTSFVSDRSTIDCWVMWERWQLGTAMTHDTEKYYDICRKQAESYTHVIYVPPMFDPPEDDFRWTNADYMRQIDRMTRLTLYDWNLLDRAYTVEVDGEDKRATAVLEWLKAKERTADV